MKISDEKYTRNNAYISWLAVCFIGNGKPKDAWTLYSQIHFNNHTFLHILANEFYRFGYFVYSLKAFYNLEKLSGVLEWDGIRGAFVGAFQMFIGIIQGRIMNTSRQQMLAVEEYEKDLLEAISNMSKMSNSQAEKIARPFMNWINSNKSIIQSKYSQIL